MVGKYALLAATVVALAATPAAATGVTNLVLNGDFESAAGGNGAQISPTPGTQNIANWSIGSRTNDPSTPGLGFIFDSGEGDNPSASVSGVYIYGPQSGSNNGLTANSGANTAGGTAGGNYLALDADPLVSGTLSQSISGLTVGAGYALSFYWATAELSNQTVTQTTEYVQASLGGQTQTTQTLTTAAAGFDPWRQVTLYFTATSATEALSFLAVGTPSGDPPSVLLDAVSLTYAPEPSTWAIMLAGVAGATGLTAMRRRAPGGDASAA
jgi:hypothetical protein